MSDSALIVGLGNPGPEYEATRHNFGFMVLDALASRGYGAGWHEKFKGLSIRARVGGATCTLLKPQTFMNLSGRSVARAAQFYGYGPTEIIVVHDDVDLPFEVVRIKKGGGTAGHKGLKSLKQDLGHTDFIRVRMGVGRPARGSVSDFVLSNFARDERIALPDIVERGADAVTSIVADGVRKAMNAHNKKTEQEETPSR